MKIVCFGDSNTYGYDPRSYFGNRYEKDSRWVDIVAEQSGFDFINLGMNGLSIPASPAEREAYSKVISDYSPDYLFIMLGSNDILQGLSAGAAAAKLKRFLSGLDMALDHTLIISPPAFRPGLWIDSGKQLEQSALLADEYRRLSEALGTMYFDANIPDMDLCYDGVHFTAQAHRLFSREILEIMRSVKEILLCWR